MRRSPILAFLAGIAILLAACEQDGELRVRNRTASDVWISVDNSEPRQLAAETNWSAYYGSDRSVTVSYNGNYVFANTVTREVKKNLVSTVDINPDGGAIRLINDGEVTLSEVYVSEAGDPNWGMDDLSGFLLPGENTLWTVTEGTWDIKAVDVDYGTHYIYGQTVSSNTTLELLFSAFGKEGRDRKHSAARNTTTQGKTSRRIHDGKAL